MGNEGNYHFTSIMNRNLKEISDERLLSLTPDDLAVTSYYITRYYAEVKLKCGLYLYIDGDDDIKYGRALCCFFR